jgi:hypothetical protein
MSTPVVIATHADGVLRCYHRAADGALSQTAQIVAQSQFEPTALAQLIGDLSALLDWTQSPNGTAQSLRSNGSVALEESSDLDTELLEALADAPKHGFLARELGDLVLSQPVTPAKRDALRKRIERLVNAGEIEKVVRDGSHHRYRLPASDIDDYRRRPRATYAERERRRDDVLAYVRAHPDQTAMQIGAAVLPDVNDATGKARAVLQQLEAAGLIRRTEHGDDPLTFAAVEQPELNSEQ